MDHSQGFLLTRADGFTETPDGDLAVVMTAKGQPVPGMEPPVRRIRFAACPACATQEVRWGEEDPLSIFSAETAQALLRLKLAEHPSSDTVAAFNVAVERIGEQVDAALAEMAVDVAPEKPRKGGKPTKATEAPTVPEGAAGE